MVHAKDVETQKFGTHLQNTKGRHERLRVNRDDLAKGLEKDKHDQKKTKPLLYTYIRCDDCELSFV